MTFRKATKLIKNELKRARKLYPKYPADCIHRAAIIAEEAGELVQAANDHRYPAGNRNGDDAFIRMQIEAVQTAAMCIRFLMGGPMMCQHKTTIIILMSINETRIFCQNCGKYRDAGKREHVWINLIQLEEEEKHARG